MTEAAAIEVQGVSLHLGSTPVLAEVGVSVRAGETVALVGPSGSGKTSLLRLMGGMLVAQEGRVSRLGQDLGQLSPSERRSAQAEVGFIYQDHQLVPRPSRRISPRLPSTTGRRVDGQVAARGRPLP